MRGTGPAGISEHENGIVHVPADGSVEDALRRLESVVRSKGLTVFARIDFSGDAGRAGLAMRPTQMLLFGSPKAGTPLMIAAPTLAIDLPLKVLIWQDSEGATWLSYNSPQYLRERHDFPADLLKNITGVAAMVESAIHDRAA